MSPDTPDREELSRLRDEFVRLQALREPLNEPEQPCPVTEEELAERRERLDRLETDRRRFDELSRKSFPLLPVLFLILAAVCLGLGFLLPFPPLRYAGLGCLVVMIVTVALRLRQNVCLRCMHPLDRRGLCPFCRQERLTPLTAGYGAFRYAGTARQLVRLLKFHFQDEAAEALAAAMAQCFPDGRYDALTPVPLHRRRLRARGANQAEILSRLVGKRTGLPVLNALTRTRFTREQSRLAGPARQRNVRGAFSAGANVSGLRLLLVDDVRTTGATARACAEALLAAGAAEVSVLTACIAVNRSKRRE